MPAMNGCDVQAQADRSDGPPAHKPTNWMRRGVAVLAKSNRRVDFLDSYQMASALERGREPGPGNRQRLGFGHRALADGEDVAVIVGPVPDCELLVPAHA